MTALPSSITSTSAEVRTVTSRSVPVTRSVVPDTSHSSLENGQGGPGAYGPVGSGEDIGESSRCARILTGGGPFFCCYWFSYEEY